MYETTLRVLHLTHPVSGFENDQQLDRGDPRELVLGSAKLTRAFAEQQAREKPNWNTEVRRSLSE